MTRVLITNDDGIDAPGLLPLAQVALAAGLDVVIAAPEQEFSGASASIIATHDAAVTAAGGKGRVHVTRREIPGFDQAHAVGAAPALIVLLALHGSFGDPPDVVLSGINHGANVGNAILHSGTVGAALTAGAGAARGLAVSLDVGLSGGDVQHFDVAASVAARLLAELVGAPPSTVWNLNVPNRSGAGTIELVEAPLAPFGIVQTTMTEADGEEVALSVREHSAAEAPGTDMERLAAGLATITAVQALATHPDETFRPRRLSAG